LTEEAHAAMQRLVNDIGGMFVRDVAQGRRVSESAVRDGFGQGRALTARAALRAHMVDRIATFEDTVARLLG
jgi:ClpP class serine protease